MGYPVRALSPYITLRAPNISKHPSQFSSLILYRCPPFPRADSLGSSCLLLLPSPFSFFLLASGSMREDVRIHFQGHCAGARNSIIRVSSLLRAVPASSTASCVILRRYESSCHFTNSHSELHLVHAIVLETVIEEMRKSPCEVFVLPSHGYFKEFFF